MTEPAAFDVIDALALVRLEKRTPTMDGSVPLRVAQGCVPLLEGNAYGHQLVLGVPLLVSRGLRPQARFVGPAGERLVQSHRAELPRLLANGHLEERGVWLRQLERGVVLARRGQRGAVQLALWTGLLVRPREGLVLRITNAQNRRNRAIEVEEMYISGSSWTPLVLRLTVVGAGGKDDAMPIEGELASIAPLPRAGAHEHVTVAMEDARDIVARHVAFYDAAYFRDKKQGVTRKYRQTIAREVASETADPSRETPLRTRIVSIGPVSFGCESPTEILTREGARAATKADVPVAIVLRNAIPFRARYQGQSVQIDPDTAALAAFAATIKERWDAGLERAEGESQHPGAFLYLSKYFTPHPPGDPHFFVKPAALVETPIGWSSLVDGIAGPGYDVLRGVVATDRFHALPAVLELHDTGRWIDVPEGTPLARVFPVPRALLNARYRVLPLDEDDARFREAADPAGAREAFDEKDVAW